MLPPRTLEGWESSWFNFSFRRALTAHSFYDHFLESGCLGYAWRFCSKKTSRPTFPTSVSPLLLSRLRPFCCSRPFPAFLPPSGIIQRRVVLRDFPVFFLLASISFPLFRPALRVSPDPPSRTFRPFFIPPSFPDELRAFSMIVLDATLFLFFRFSGCVALWRFQLDVFSFHDGCGIPCSDGRPAPGETDLLSPPSLSFAHLGIFPLTPARLLSPTVLLRRNDSLLVS